MRHQGTVGLETERLVLRRFEIGDAGAMFRNWACDPEVTKFLTWSPYSSEETADRVLAEWIRNYERPDWYQWAIEWKASGEPIGSISVVRMDESIDECELGWCVGRPWWGMGVMTEAAGAVTRFLFDAVGANRVAARHAVENPRSGRVMQKLGMRREGTLRQASRSNQGLEDVVQYAILAEDRGKSR